jgi:hypothetical protein
MRSDISATTAARANQVLQGKIDKSQFTWVRSDTSVNAKPSTFKLKLPAVYLTGWPPFEMYANKLSTVSPAKVTFPALVDDEQEANLWEPGQAIMKHDRRTHQHVTFKRNFFDYHLQCPL